MSALRDWLLSVTAAALGVALVGALTPEGPVKRVGRLVGGLALLLTVLRPLKAWEPVLPAFPQTPLEEAQAAQSGWGTWETLIAEETSAYIADKGLALGLTCEARVTLARDEAGWPVPWEVTVTGTWSEEQRGELSRLLAEDLGIPAHRQSFLSRAQDREEGA